MTTRHAVAIILAFAASMALTTASKTLGACYKWNNAIGCCTAQHTYLMDESIRCLGCDNKPKYVVVGNHQIPSYEKLPTGSGTAGWNINNFTPNGSPFHGCRYQERDCTTCELGEPESLPCQRYDQPTGNKDCTA